MSNNKDVEITKRRVNLQFETDAAVHWLPGEAVVEQFLNTISFFFPSGEKFFLDSVAYYKNKVNDPLLRDALCRFMYQEAMHTAVHRRCNKALLTLYPCGNAIDSIGSFVLNIFRLFFPASFQLAISCAVEHYTAILADSLFHYLDYIIERAHPDFAKLWAWHAVEETEHKSVCFDLYEDQVGVGVLAYLMRIAAMILVTMVGVPVITLGVLIIRSGSKLPRFSCDDRPAPAPNLKTNTLSLINSLIPWRALFSYFKPSFHPWDHDNRQQIEIWKQKFPNFGLSSDD